jgi:Protein of unknown function (DUF551)
MTAEVEALLARLDFVSNNTDTVIPEEIEAVSDAAGALIRSQAEEIARLKDQLAEASRFAVAEELDGAGLRAEIEELREQIAAAAQQEPVAWMSPGGDASRSKKYFEEMGFTDLIPLYAAPIPADSTSVEWKKAWLIERDSPAQYVVDEHYGSVDWTEDPQKAMRFPDEAMAERFIKITILRVESGLRVCAHLFETSAAPVPAEPVQIDMYGKTLNWYADELFERAPQRVNSADGALAVQASQIIRWLATKIAPVPAGDAVSVPVGWIAVSDRLPPSTVTWCWASDGLNSFPAIWDYHSKQFDRSGPWCTDDMREITHWMPMPDAPARPK